MSYVYFESENIFSFVYTTFSAKPEHVINSKCTSLVNPGALASAQSTHECMLYVCKLEDRFIVLLLPNFKVSILGMEKRKSSTAGLKKT